MSTSAFEDVASNGHLVEGRLTKAIEHKTARVPSLTYLGLAGGALALSLALAATQKEKWRANFVGLWVPTILMMGLYNKLVKIHGSDHEDLTEE